MKTIRMLQLTLISTLLNVSFFASADVVSGKIEFVKRVPFTGVLYVADAGGSIKKPIINQKDKDFTSKVAVGSPSDIITFKNSDTFDHNIYANDAKQNVNFDVGLMVPNNSVEKSIDWVDDSLVRIGCKIHPKMRGYVANIKSDYYHSFDFEKKVTSYDFSIDSIPSNKNDLVLLMPKYEKLLISLKKGESKTVDIEVKGKVKATITLSRS